LIEVSAICHPGSYILVGDRNAHVVMYFVHIFLSDHDDCSHKKMLTEKIASAEGTSADGLKASPHDANDECEIETRIS
jgi:hypothetical protein